MPEVKTPRSEGYRQPAEWEPHAAVWMAWPSHDVLWSPMLGDAQAQTVALCEAIADLDGSGTPRGEPIHMLVPDGVRHLEASEALEAFGARCSRMPFGDIWMRDIAPIFVCGDQGDAAVCFAFNGWGGKYVLDGDELVAGRVAELAGARLFAFGFVLEGGSVEADGEGTLLTTRQCLLNPNRNPGMDARALEDRLGEALAAERVLWLDRGLMNDHTDGHVDTLARFVAPGRVVCMQPHDDEDPNHGVLSAIDEELSHMVDAAGRRLQVERIPSPGRITDHEGMILPASYLNFYIANTTVVVPTFGSPHDDEAVELIGALFEDRRAVGARANGLLTGGGAFHCVTQPQPLVGGEA